MLHLEKVTSKNVWNLLALQVSEDQTSFVATNTESIIEAYTATVAGGHAFPFGVFDGETPVGFLMIGYDVDDTYDNAPQIAYGNYSIWRLMIDQNFQHRGFGSQAIALALDYVRTFPCGQARFCWLSYAPENTVAAKLYHAAGFAENGQMDGDEIVAVIKL